MPIPTHIASFQHSCRRVLADTIAVSVWRATHPTKGQQSSIGPEPEQQQQQQHLSLGISGLESYDEWGVDELAQPAAGMCGAPFCPSSVTPLSYCKLSTITANSRLL
eukprot:scaffold252523_cov20-Tisochrysis_lutea.AAC.1